jgi:hypothetical protein
MEHMAQNKNSYPNLKTLILFASGFFVILWSFFSVATVSGKLIKDKGYGNLGFHGLTSLYLSFSCFCMFAPSIASMMKTQRAL